MTYELDENLLMRAKIKMTYDLRTKNQNLLKRAKKKIYLPVKVSNPLLLHVFLSMPHDIVSHWVSLDNTLTFRVPVIKSTPTQHSIP